MSLAGFCHSCEDARHEECSGCMCRCPQPKEFYKMDEEMSGGEASFDPMEAYQSLHDRMTQLEATLSVWSEGLKDHQKSHAFLAITPMPAHAQVQERTRPSYDELKADIQESAKQSCHAVTCCDYHMRSPMDALRLLHLCEAWVEFLLRLTFNCAGSCQPTPYTYCTACAARELLFKAGIQSSQSATKRP